MKRTDIHHKIGWLSLIAMLIAGILACSAVAQTEGTSEGTSEGTLEGTLEGTSEKTPEGTSEGTPGATVQSEEPKLEAREKTEAAADDAEEGEEINGSADNLERFEKEGITILTGNVKILRTDGYLNADKVTFYTDPVTGDTVRTVAESNVEIRDAEIFATCEHATMEHLTNTIILKTDVVVLQNKDRLETVLFTYNRTTGEQTAQGDVKFKVRVIEAEPVPAEEAPKAAEEIGETAASADEAAAADAPAAPTAGEAPAEEGEEKAETNAEVEVEEPEAPAAEGTGSSEADSQQTEEAADEKSAGDDSAEADSQQTEEGVVENETDEDK